VLFNRMSPSADGRQHGSGIFHSLAYLEHLERQGIRVLNGAQAFRYEISKASQASLLKSLNLRFIPSRVIHAANQAVAAAAGLRYPIVVKPNIGGSGKGQSWNPSPSVHRVHRFTQAANQRPPKT
jgi:glutathione synthase/RimK-type ligase-like ATP-grasp enzyme